MATRLLQAALAIAATAAFVATFPSAPVASAQPQPTAPPDFVSLSDVDPSILLDIRYDTPHNFTGDHVDGYQAPMCLLTRPAAEALSRAQTEFLEEGYTLKVYDCYRRQRAVNDFVAWANNPFDQRRKAGRWSTARHRRQSASRTTPLTWAPATTASTRSRTPSIRGFRAIS